MEIEQILREAADHAKELELTVKMQKSIINDLELRLGEEKALCAVWRKRALLAEKESGERDVEGAVPYKAKPDAEARAPELRPYEGDPFTLYRRAIKVFGAPAQKLKCVEELLELALALVRDQLGRTDLVNIAEERADVEIMLCQLSIIQDDQKAADAWAREKLRRLEQMVEAEEEQKRNFCGGMHD